MAGGRVGAGGGGEGVEKSGAGRGLAGGGEGEEEVGRGRLHGHVDVHSFCFLGGCKRSFVECVAGINRGRPKPKVSDKVECVEDGSRLLLMPAGAPVLTANAAAAAAADAGRRRRLFPSVSET